MDATECTPVGPTAALAVIIYVPFGRSSAIVKDHFSSEDTFGLPSQAERWEGVSVAAASALLKNNKIVSPTAPVPVTMLVLKFTWSWPVCIMVGLIVSIIGTSGVLYTTVTFLSAVTDPPDSVSVAVYSTVYVPAAFLLNPPSLDTVIVTLVSSPLAS